MSRFDTAPAKTGDFFARHNPERLKGMFGTTEVTPLWVADMDFAVADPIQEALRYVAERGQFAYEINPERIFQAISGWHQRRYGLTLKPENFVAFPGVLTAIALLIRELSDEGDGIVIQVPVYHQFAKLISTAGREIVTNPMINTDGTYTMDFVDLERKLAPETVKLMLLCNPHNPVGRVWRDDELARLVEIAERHNVTVISDEVHADIIYGDHTFNSLATLDNGRHVTVLGSPAKTFGMQSIANGYIYTENDAFFARMKHIEESMYLGHGNAFTTHATIAAYEKGDAWVDELLVYLQGTIDWVADYLQNELPSISMSPVEGTYQIWLDCSKTGLQGEALVAKMAEAGFGGSPGTWFDEKAACFVRINIAAPRADIQDAFRRFRAVLSK